MAYSIDPLTADCYPGTAVLINKLDIKDTGEGYCGGAWMLRPKYYQAPSESAGEYSVSGDWGVAE